MTTPSSTLTAGRLTTNAVFSNDLRIATKIERLIGFGAKKIEEENELKYEVRFVNMNISPMAEALVLHSMTIKSWVEE